ncbi:TetR/AcrR family transcriptional regulator [Nocardia colli]|uniref:TetR/AcrR family transcriptional regulator n=1 Tax=Nocardia colli TaxID=2545717 RepID=A0A5N0DLH7_9NOCA|nr:TetR family transcriptional regulator [Nocardia colli]KAA8877310.1 TetR/AcrR family transcriptional regulator [Nocardia colli]
MAFTPRSEATRESILRAARHSLLENGFDGMTIRGVAAEAGVDAAMVMRYHGSKEGLFAAAIDPDLQLPDLRGCPPDRLGEQLARHFVRLWEGDLTDDILTILLRSVATHPVAKERMRAIFEGQVLELVRTVTGDAPDTSRRAALLAAQVAGVALCRYAVELPALVDVDASVLVTNLAPVFQHYLTGNLDGSVVEPR